MANLPIQRDIAPFALAGPSQPPPPPEDELSLPQILGALRRNVWIILSAIALGIGAGVWMTQRAVPVYRAAATVRIEEKTPDLPGFFRSTGAGSELSTEAQVLRSRSIAESAVAELGLGLRLVAPVDVSRDELVDSIRVDSVAPAGTYELRAAGSGRFIVVEADSGREVGTARVGGMVRVPGARFRLTPAAAEHGTLVVRIRPRATEAQDLASALSVAPPGRDANILRVEYEDTDRVLAWKVPNAIVAQFIARRTQDRSEEARSTVAFLRRQLDTLASQLVGAENQLKAYRERNLVVNPEAEASSQVSRLVTMELERTTLDGERTALAQLVADVDRQAQRRQPGDPSPYRQLLAFPTLLRNQAATDLMNTLSTVEQERTTLLARRTPDDPDVKALDNRINELEGQLRSVVAAYLQGLGNQIATLDAGLQRFGSKLGELPQRELEVARLERQPKVLGEIYTLLQTRLKEAEIAEAARDPSVRLVDSALPPRWPVRPRPLLNILVGAVGGLLLGLALMFVRELRDGAVRTRADIRVATGLPVLGLIPRIPIRGSKLALITEKRTSRQPSAAPAGSPSTVAPASTAGPRRRQYTFLGGRPEEPEEPARPAAATTSAPTAPPPAHVLSLAVSELGLPVAEAYGILETNIAFSRPDAEVKLVVLTSALPGEGKTTTAVNLALSLARRGLSVLLIDADLRRGMVHTAFEAKRAPGLTEVLTGAIPLEQARRPVEVETRVLHFLTAGTCPAGPTSLIHSGAMRELLERVRQEYDLVILDSPPANIVTDAAILAAMADGVIMVARSGYTEGGAMTVALDQLRHVRAPVLGVILNDIDFKRDAVYDGAYRYYNYSQYMSSGRG